jgi:hypothetical protein
MTTQTTTSENRIWIQWTAETKIVNQYKSIDDLVESGYLNTYASNFGYNHLIEREVKSWSKYTVHNIFIVDADPQYNYGLNFKMYIHYTADQINFFAELTIGSKSITNGALIRVMLTHRKPEGLNIHDVKSNSEEILKEWFDNMDNDIYDSFCFSTNACYNKGREFRNELREMSKSPNFIFA